MALSIGDIINLAGSGIGLFETIDRNNKIEDMIQRGTDTSDITQQQLGTTKNLFDLLYYGSNPAAQADLGQLDTGFYQPAVSRFTPAYDTALGRFTEGERYAPGTLRDILQSRARQGIEDAYGDVTNTVAMQALRTGTNAADTMSELAKQRARDTSAALRDAGLAAITGSEQLNLARRESGQKDLATAQNPLLEALKTREPGGTALLGANQNIRDTAARGSMSNIQSGFGTQAQARAGAVQPAAFGQWDQQPYSSAFMLGTQALSDLCKKPVTGGGSAP